jgi:hypothetical protein
LERRGSAAGESGRGRCCCAFIGGREDSGRSHAWRGRARGRVGRPRVGSLGQRWRRGVVTGRNVESTIARDWGRSCRRTRPTTWCLRALDGRARDGEAWLWRGPRGLVASVGVVSWLVASQLSAARSASAPGGLTFGPQWLSDRPRQCGWLAYLQRRTVSTCCRPTFPCSLLNAHSAA